MGESLTQRRRVEDDAVRGVNSFSGGRNQTVPQQQAPANSVPAAAVIRRGQALSGFTGRKGRVGRGASRLWKLLAQPGEAKRDGAARGRQRVAELAVEW